MADQSISCPSVEEKIPLTRALRAEIEASLKLQFDDTLQDRERELRAKYESGLEEDLRRAQADAVKKAEKRSRAGTRWTEESGEGSGERSRGGSTPRTLDAQEGARVRTKAAGAGADGRPGDR